MNIIHPKPEHLAQRDRMLQKTMRPNDVPYAITKEYPIVLSDKHNHLSFCLMDNDIIAAHSNFWPRKLLINHQPISVALIGNVATAEAYRGKGLAKKIISHCQQQAKSSRIDALILWSELSTFYQKLGFTSLSQERRYSLECRYFLPTTSRHDVSTHDSAAALSNRQLDRCLSLRPKADTLLRSIEEFRSLLSIPDCYIFTALKNDELMAYAIVGKGCDMAGVIHEWGAANEQAMTDIFTHVFRLSGWPNLVTLTPQKLNEDWLRYFESLNASSNLHDMAMVWWANPVAQKECDSVFIWGLDSI